jgi:NAD(P)-dependent dehydrogenase (short-subunit alcohol dehydrogenase family)
MSTPIKDESWPRPGEMVVPDEFPGSGDVKGRRVVITGASRGLGRVLAHAFCQSGAILALVSRTEADLQRLEDELDGDVVTYAVDVTNEEQSDELAQTLADRWGGIDVWIANAGISPSYGPAPEVQLEDWRQVIDVNLTSVFIGARSCSPFMAEGGRFIATSSVLGERPMAGLSAYCASKAGLIGLVKVLALELAPREITVNAVSCGWFDSPMASDWRNNERRDAMIRRHTPLGRWGGPTDLVGAYLFFASLASSFVTGSVLDVDGGYLLA